MVNLAALFGPAIGRRGAWTTSSDASENGVRGYLLEPPVGRNIEVVGRRRGIFLQRRKLGEHGWPPHVTNASKAVALACSVCHLAETAKFPQLQRATFPFHL